MSDDVMVYPLGVDRYIDDQLVECMNTFANISEKRLKTMNQEIRFMYRQAGIEEPTVIDIAWLKRQRSHRNQKTTGITVNKPTPEYVHKCIDKYWDMDKRWNTISDDVRNTMVKEIKKLYEENKEKPNSTITPKWIQIRRLQRKRKIRLKRKLQTDKSFNEEQKAKREKWVNKKIQVEFDGDREAFYAHYSTKLNNPELYEKQRKREKERYASDPNLRARAVVRNRENRAKRRIEVGIIFAKDPPTRTVEENVKLDKSATDLMINRRRMARRRYARNIPELIHKGIFVEKYEIVVYSTHSTLYMSGFNLLQDFSNFLCKNMEKKHDWAIKKHGSALKALFHQDNDNSQTFEIDEIFACHMFDNTPEHQVALWHFSNTQVLTSSQNNAKSKNAKRTKAFYDHVVTVNKWYCDNEEHAFKVVASNIASIDKVRNVLKSKSPETSHVPESCNESAWIRWYNELDKGKNDYRKKVKKLDEASTSWLHSYIKQVNDY